MCRLFMWHKHCRFLCLDMESDMTKEHIEKLLKAGGNVLLMTKKGIDDMALTVIFLR